MVLFELSSVLMTLICKMAWFGEAVHGLSQLGEARQGKAGSAGRGSAWSDLAVLGR
jgi:hypothetical protein